MASQWDILDLPASIQAALEGRDVVVFDGECVLCSGFYRFILRHDRAGSFAFVIAQSPLGDALYRALGLPTRDYETNLVIVEGQIFARLDAFAAVMRVLGMPWRLLSVARRLPAWLKDPLYERIARNRYRIFGRHETCLVPDAETRGRFLVEGY